MQTVLDSDRYRERRAWLEEYFDRTAATAWERLTSDAPVSGVRARVRAGRDRTRAILAGWLPESLAGCRILDAGCGPGMLSLELAARGAHVIGVDLSPTLIGLARERGRGRRLAGSVEFRAGDMLDPSLGDFDWIVAMDSLIHYGEGETVGALAGMAQRARNGVLFTVVPRTPLLSFLHAAGRFFPRGDRSPSIEPIAPSRLVDGISGNGALGGWQVARTARISAAFYVSQAMELIPHRTPREPREAER